MATQHVRRVVPACDADRPLLANLRLVAGPSIAVKPFRLPSPPRRWWPAAARSSTNRRRLTAWSGWTRGTPRPCSRRSAVHRACAGCSCRRPASSGWPRPACSTTTGCGRAPRVLRRTGGRARPRPWRWPGFATCPTRVRARSWGKPAGTSLYDQRVTILGGGGITSVAARAARPLPGAGDGGPAAARSRCRCRSHRVPPLICREVLPGSLVVFLALALTPETEHIIGARRAAT